MGVEWYSYKAAYMQGHREGVGGHFALGSQLKRDPQSDEVP
jgi:hypothetical protein